MNMYNNPHSAYKTSAGTNSKTRQVVMLFDGAIKFMKQAAVAIKNEKYEDRYNLLQRASTVVLGLQASLDFEKGEKIAEVLNNYYCGMDIRITMVNQSNSTKECEDIIRDLKKMRDAFDEVDKQTNGGSSSQDESSGAEIISKKQEQGSLAISI